MANTGPNKQALEKYLRDGLTQQQIADAWERDSGFRVGRTTIAMAIARHGLESAHPRPRYEETIPWRVATQHLNRYDARMLRLEGRRRLGGALDRDDQTRLSAWLNELTEKGAVVAYDPLTPEGFFWLEREPHHDDIIDRPAHHPDTTTA